MYKRQIVGRALALDDLGAGSAHVVFDLVKVEVGEDAGAQLDEILVLQQVDGADLGDGPGDEGSLAVLAEPVGVDVLFTDVQICLLYTSRCV